MKDKLLQAIKNKCLDCCCFDKKQVEDCPIEECPLWGFREEKEDKKLSTDKRLDEVC